MAKTSEQTKKVGIEVGDGWYLVQDIEGTKDDRRLSTEDCQPFRLNVNDLTDGVAVTIDLDAGHYHYLALTNLGGGTRQLNNPSNVVSGVSGQSVSYVVEIYDSGGVGTQAITFDSKYTAMAGASYETGRTYTAIGCHYSPRQDKVFYTIVQSAAP